jgi:hypothetical protein
MLMPGHDLMHIKGTGMTTSALCTQICALVFGKHEDGFIFSYANVDLLTTWTRDLFDGSLQHFFVLVPHFLKPIEALCISDANKALLVKSSSLVPLLLAALFMDPEHHPRNDVDQAVKAAIQTDAADCFLQIALYGPGRELLAADAASISALHALADGTALTSKAKLSADGAILAIEGPSHEPQSELIGAQHGACGRRHAMVRN